MTYEEMKEISDRKKANLLKKDKAKSSREDKSEVKITKEDKLSK